MDSDDLKETTKPAVNQGYRQGLVTAITVFLGFSLSFMRFWSFENPGDWSWQDILSGCILAAGIGVQLYALFRSLDLRDDQEVRYKATVRYFFWGILIVIVGVVVAIVEAA
jgi:Na+/H+ antiporter NhaA